ncbi:MAG: helix-turn-helix transcriptional regulator [Anaerolineae bacterium]|nr:helix-turn-helix transcriptional regulator [Anaerolineae bacterium]
MESARSKELLGDLHFRKPYVPTLAEQIADEIVRLRIKFGLTQEDLASKLGTTQSAVSRVESGTRLPSARFLEKIADALDVKLVVRYEDRPVVSQEAAWASIERAHPKVIHIERRLRAGPPPSRRPARWKQPEQPLAGITFRRTEVA